MRKLRSPWLVKLITPLMSLSLVWLEMCPSYALAARMNREEEARKPVIQVAEALKKHNGPVTSVPKAPVQNVRSLSADEMQKVRGRGALRNPYFNGTLPWQRSFHDVNICTGNLFKSFTDMQVAPARGAGLVLQRTYNSNDARVGPFGVGWTHAYDIRVQEAPDVAAQSGNNTDTKVDDVPRTDFFGGKHTYHRDADGLYSPPPYMHDELNSDYGKFLVNGPPQIFDDTERSADGTIKHFMNIVTKPDGSSANERACDYIQDRHGNTTTLTYAQSYVQPDGSTRKLLTKVTDPSNRNIVFTWTNLGTTGAPAYRVTQVQGPYDNGVSVAGVTYRVTYDYYTDTNSPNAANELYNLKAVHLDPDGLNRTTVFTYTSCTDSAHTGQTENGLLASIQQTGVDSYAQGHLVSYTYQVPDVYAGSSASLAYATSSVWVNTITEPAGVDANNVPRTTLWTIGVGNSNNYHIYNSTPGLPGVASLSMQVLMDWDHLRMTDLSAGEPDITGSWHDIVYDAQNNPIYKTSVGSVTLTGPWAPLAQEDAFQYDTMGHVIQHQAVSANYTTPMPAQPTAYFPGIETATYYDASKYFQKASSTDMNGHTSTTDYYDNQDPSVGNRGELKWGRDARYTITGKQYSYTYNSYGQKLTETNLNDVVTQNTYGDKWGNLTNTVQDSGTGHLARSTSITYDVASHVVNSVDPAGQASAFQCNVLGQPLTVTAPATPYTPAETMSYVYDGAGRTVSITDSRGQTLMAYELGDDRTHSVTDPITGTTTYTYGISGERSSMSLPSGRAWKYAYVVGGYQQSTVVPSDDPNKVMPKLKSISDDQGRVTEYQIDPMGRLIQIKSNEIFDTNGALKSYMQADYSYDGPQLYGYQYSHLWLASIKTSWHTTVGYQNTSRLLSENDYTYDNGGLRQTNQITMPVTNADGSPQYTGGTPVYDGSGNVTNEITSTRTETYGYDEVNRLTSVNYGDGETQSYQFDPMGNRLVKGDTVGGTTTTTTYGYDAANRLTTLNGNTSAYTNDADGNTLTGGGRSLTWDSQNRMTKSVIGGVTSTYTYAADGLRRSLTTNGVTTNYGYDASMIVSEYQKDAQNQNVATVTYLQGQNGPTCRIDETQQDEGYYNATGTLPAGLQARGRSKWYVFDGLGSVVGEVDYNGNLTGTKHFDVYGATRATTGTATTRQGFVGSLGHQTDTVTGLVYMQARYYDPMIGRFASEDPHHDRTNWYIYCDSNPTNGVDPTGKWLLLAAILICGIVGAFWEGKANGFTFKNLLIGFLIGVLVAAAGIAFGWVGGAIAGAILSGADAAWRHQNWVVAALLGAVFGGIGGWLGQPLKGAGAAAAADNTVQEIAYILWGIMDGSGQAAAGAAADASS